MPGFTGISHRYLPRYYWSTLSAWGQGLRLKRLVKTLEEGGIRVHTEVLHRHPARPLSVSDANEDMMAATRRLPVKMLQGIAHLTANSKE